MELRNTVLTKRILCNFLDCTTAEPSWCYTESFRQVLFAGSGCMQNHYGVEQSFENVWIYTGFKTRSSAANSLKKQMLKPLHLQSQRFIFVCWSTELLNHQVLCGSTNGFANISKGPLRGWRGAWNGEISTAKLVASKSQSLSTTAYTESLMVEPTNTIQIILWR